ncbi:trans-sialidase [Trypanosoma theileri]|uniref:Trans-sialidase n=1 Tax=Trypanosoma theileri TaxID=67003 RepID=A0A1X0NXN7_9TRYP|nr:trans-sialidase [Trypanosoma theileri]ORC89318.1 trans-sialidase [Trypanosoma theileri]
MTRPLFVLLFLFLLGCISGYAQGSRFKERTTRTIGNDKELFQVKNSAQEVKVDVGHEKLSPLSSFTGSEVTSPRNFQGSYLWLGNGKLVAIDTAATAMYQKSTNKSEFIDFLTQESSDNGKNWGETQEKRFGIYSFPYAQELEKHKMYDNHRSVFVLVESNNLQSQYRSQSQGTEINTKNSTLRTVRMYTGNDENGKYSLSYFASNIAFPFTKGNEMVVRFLVDEITPILRMTNYGFVFPVQFVTTDKKIISTVMVDKFEDDNWNVSSLTEEGTYNPAVLEWKNGNLMMIAHHTSGHYRVYESTDLGKTWTESTSTLSRVWSTSTVATERGSQNNFITATIDGKRVILFLQSVGSEYRKKLYLWVTDNTRIYHVGMIVENKKVKRSTLLFKDNKLYSLYETVEGGDQHKVIFVDLTTSMEEIKRVLNKWTELDQTLSESRCCADNSGISSRQCKYPVPTIGLVGYLSGNIDEGKWNDEYLGVSASVSGVPEKNPNGLTLKGIGAGAKWPVNTDGLAKQYYFTNYAFTLAATVTIHEVPKKENSPLLGVKMNKSKKRILFGLSFNKDNTWSTINRDESSGPTGKWEVNKAYSVILTLKDGKAIVYINGIRLSAPYYAEMEGEEEVSHFYFGSENWGGDNIHVTIKNVMLYNRVLLRREINALVENNMSIVVADAKKEISEQASMTDSSQSPVIHSPSRPQSTSSREYRFNERQANSQTADPLRRQGGRRRRSAETPKTEDASENNMQKHSSSKTTLPNIHDNNTHPQNTIDGTARVYGYGLPMLVVGLWALATILL